MPSEGEEGHRSGDGGGGQLHHEGDEGRRARHLLRRDDGGEGEEGGRGLERDTLLPLCLRFFAINKSPSFDFYSARLLGSSQRDGKLSKGFPSGDGVDDDLPRGPPGLEIGEGLHHLREWEGAPWVNEGLHLPVLYVGVQLRQRLPVGGDDESEARGDDGAGQENHAATFFRGLRRLLSLPC